jgi:putative inorganic carbon (HCO3(-)) transporter
MSDVTVIIGAGPARRADPRRMLVGAGVAIAIVLGGVAIGLALGAVGLVAGPLAILALPAVCLAWYLAWNRPVIAPILICASMPIGLHTIIEAPLHVQVIDAAAAFAVAVVALPRVIDGRRPFEWHPLMWGYVALWGVALAASLAAPDRGAAINQLGLWALYGLVALTIITVVRTSSDASWFVGAYLIGASIVCAMALPQAAKSQVQYGGGLIVGRPTGIFSQPNELGSFAAVLVCVALGAVFLTDKRLLRWIAVPATLIGAAAAALSYSRGAVIGVGFGVVTIIVLMGRQRWRLILPIVAVGVAMGALLVVGAAPERLQTVVERVATVGSKSSANPYDDRPLIWHEAVQLIKERPLLGFGPASFPAASARIQGPDIWPTTRRPLGQWRLQPGADHAHDTLLTLGAELGVLAPLIAVGLTIGTAVVAFRTVRRRPEPGFRVATVGAAGALGSVVGHGIVDFPFRNPQLLAMVLMLFATVLAADRWTPTPSPDATPDRSPA